MGLNFKGLEETALVLLNEASFLVCVEKIFGDLSLQDNVLVEELDLVAEILLHDISEDSYMGQVAASLQDYLHLFRG